MPFGSDPFRDSNKPSKRRFKPRMSHQCLSAVIPFGTMRNPVLNDLLDRACHQCLSAVIPFGTYQS